VINTSQFVLLAKENEVRKINFNLLQFLPYDGYLGMTVD
jgi:hypothetical protein